MNCPKCKAAMDVVPFEGFEVDRCTDCQGLWFDEFEKDELKKLKGSETIDIGDAQAGERFNRRDRIECPRCGGGRMIRMVDVDQPHIWFEHCTVCGGSFFDAGEFRDLKHRGIGEFFKNLLGKARE